MKHVLKPALALFIIAAITTSLLVIAHNLTLEPIAKQAKKTQEKTMKEVLAQASRFREFSGDNAVAGKSGCITGIYEGLSNDSVIGYVVELAPSGYSGAVNMMVGILKTERLISGMRILKHSETPGLGALAVKENFYRKYDGKTMVPLFVVKANPGSDEIEAITGATITTKAVTYAVNEAIQWFNSVFAPEGDDE